RSDREGYAERADGVGHGDGVELVQRAGERAQTAVQARDLEVMERRLSLFDQSVAVVPVAAAAGCPIGEIGNTTRAVGQCVVHLPGQLAFGWVAVRTVR